MVSFELFITGLMLCFIVLYMLKSFKILEFLSKINIKLKENIKNININIYNFMNNENKKREIMKKFNNFNNHKKKYREII